MRSRHLLTLALLALTGSVSTATLNLPNPILFVTQVPIPTELNDNAVSNVFVWWCQRWEIIWRILLAIKGSKP